MQTAQLIDMLNKDIAEEHAAILRYLVHSYLEGEDTPIGASLLSRCREEMWHMHWLGMIIGQLGGEPNLDPADYPHDPTNRSTIFKSYVEYEENLIPHYNKEAEIVDDPHIKRVLHREAWESAYHAKKFQKTLNKLTEEEANSLPGDEPEMDPDLLEKLQTEVSDKYTDMLQHIRNAWVYQEKGRMSWDLMDQSMAKMKQLAHFSEDVAENGMEPRFTAGVVDTSQAVETGLKASLGHLRMAHDRHKKLINDVKLKEHSGLVVSLDLTIRQEEYQLAELEDWISFVKKG